MCWNLDEEKMICGYVPEMLAIKVKSCEKTRQILDVSALPDFVGAGPKSHKLVITSAPGRSHAKVS